MPNEKKSTVKKESEYQPIAKRMRTADTTIRVSREVRDGLERVRELRARQLKPRWRYYTRRSDCTMDQLLAEIVDAMNQKLFVLS